MSGDVTGKLISLDRYPDLAADWQRLEQTADGTPFTSWIWVSIWLHHLPETIRPIVFCAHDRNGLVALSLLVEAPERGFRRVFGRRSLHMQETGNRDLDEITIEYAGLLVLPGHATGAYAALFAALSEMDSNWRSLHLSASEDAALILDALPDSLRAYCNNEQATHRVNLAALRESGQDYVTSLGSRTRRGLRQTRRSYEELGELSVEVARDAGQALIWLDQMRALHQAHWQSKGQAGSFASAFFCAFHRDLIRAGTASGLTQMMRIKAGSSTVGFLYNLTWKNHVYFYNSGLSYGLLSRNDRPGFIAQWLAIESHAAAGMDIYDFLAGDQPYKLALGSEMRALHWIAIRPAGWRLASERALSGLTLRNTSRPLAIVIQKSSASSPN